MGHAKAGPRRSARLGRRLATDARPRWLVCSAAVLQPALVGVELVARDETRPNAACDRTKLTCSNEGSDVLLGAAELGGDVANCEAFRLLHPGKYRSPRHPHSTSARRSPSGSPAPAVDGTARDPLFTDGNAPPAPISQPAPGPFRPRSYAFHRARSSSAADEGALERQAQPDSSRRRRTRDGSSASDVSSSARRACSRASASRPSAA